MKLKPQHLPILILAILTLIILMFGTPGCAEGGHCEVALDADVPEGCFPEDPCCEADSRLSPAGAPCGSGLLQDLHCDMAPYTTVLLPTCSGTSALCDGPVVEVPRAQGQCLEGYHCRIDNDNRCRWIGREYNAGN